MTNKQYRREMSLVWDRALSTYMEAFDHYSRIRIAKTLNYIRLRFINGEIYQR
jgi:hypothetical protein